MQKFGDYPVVDSWYDFRFWFELIKEVEQYFRLVMLYY